MKDTNDINLKKFILIVGITFLVSIFAAFGMGGTRTFLAIIVLYFFPFYYILRIFDFSEFERIFFSLFISLGIFPTFVYYISFLFGSLKISIVVSFFLLLLIGFLLKYIKKNSNPITPA